MRVLTFSTSFPKGHPKALQPTWFVESILNSILRKPDGSLNLDDIMPAARPYVNDFQLIAGNLYKHHTIRAGSRWKAGDMASLRIWSGSPYRSKQIEFAQVEVVKTWDIEIIIKNEAMTTVINGMEHAFIIDLIAKNDGLSLTDFYDWFNVHKKKKRDVFTGQVLCWSPNVSYP